MDKSNDRLSEVKRYFENTHLYLGKDGVNTALKLRMLIISKMMEKEPIESLLDVPCGNGLISIPFLKNIKELVMIDIAGEMIKLAKDNVPVEYLGKVSFIKNNVFDVDFKNKTFDAIFAIGILAHVLAPNDFLEKVNSLIKPNGVLILQNTDADHFIIRTQKVLRGQKDLIQKNSYKLNSISHKDLVKKVKSLGYRLECTYRYQFNIPFLSLFVQKEKQLSVIKCIFGMPFDNRFSFLGSKCIYKFRKIE
jgi:2-polyprenyl-3-methyl-5-hydroxy-6-metoxy-1,4-benzoquinol methylase